ncbi:MAG: hypothetical protein NC411_04925 [Bacteroides sp.]|nr:hypothetical protein [Bacteroides sp.]
MNANKETNIERHDLNQQPQRRRRPLWLKILRVSARIVVSLLVITLLAITIAVSYLKPERLTPLVEKVANGYLHNAELSVGRMEISFWHTFPKFELDINELTVISHSLDSLSPDFRDEIPEYADSLLHITRFNGAVNIPSLLAGKIAFYDIIFTRPTINIVIGPSGKSNFDIFPETSEKTDDDSPVIIPDITLGTFEIRDDMPVRYVSIPDSTDIRLTLSSTRLEGNSAPDYHISIEGNTTTSLPHLTLDNLKFGLGGKIVWTKASPYELTLDNFSLSAGDVRTTISTAIDFSHELKINTFQFHLPETPAQSIIDLIPGEMMEGLSGLDADFNVKLAMSLTRPFTPATDSIPSLEAEIIIPEGRMSLDRLILNRLALTADIKIDGENTDASVIDLKRLLAVGKGVGFELDATITTPMSNPSVKGSFKGGIEFDRLPDKLLEKLPFTLSGSLRADSRFNFRKSYLDKNEFHRIRLTGDATLDNFSMSMPSIPAELYARHAELRLGTNSSFTRGEVTVDSLLTASLMIDTVSTSADGLELQAKGVKMGVGCRNTTSSADTTIINPIGGRIVAEKITFRSPDDSTRIRLRQPTVGATLRRYKGDKTKPQLVLNIATEGAFYADAINRALLSNALLFVTAYPSDLPQRPQQTSRLIYSLRTANPDLPDDSIRQLASDIRQKRLREMKANDSASIATGEILDIGIDNSMRRLLHTWKARGILKADRMRLFTPLFPLRNTLTGLDLRFNTDSIVITDTRFRAGKTSVTMDGDISNITRALTSRVHRQPLRIDLTLTGDTIEVNEIAAAIFTGAAYAENNSTGIFTDGDDDDESRLQTALDRSSDNSSDTMSVLVIPSNIEAKIKVKAGHIAYSNLMFTDFDGNLNVSGGAVNLDEMTAHTSVGSINLNALYSAPRPADASFAFGMRLHDFHIRQFLDLVPAIDSLMPLLYDIDGVINADLAATMDIDRGMNIDIPSLKAAVRISGDSLVLIDRETFRKIGKWLLFKQKNRNVIDRMNVEMIVRNSQLELFPFIFDIDRYKLGVMGTNDLAMNLNYHIAILKSPLPFKFGINITGNVDDMKIRLGGAKFNEKNMPKAIAIADTTRINLVREISNLFRRGVRDSKITPLSLSGIPTSQIQSLESGSDTITHADSLYFMKEGLIAPPDSVAAEAIQTKQKKKSDK